MKVILLKDIKKLGKKGDVIEVADGYAKNCLLPQKNAIPADAQALSERKSNIESEKHKKELERQHAEDLQKLLNGKTVQIVAKAGNNGKLFGSVTSKDIAEKILEDFGASVDKRKIVLAEDIKSFGAYNIGLKLYHDITAELKVMVIEK